MPEVAEQITKPQTEWSTGAQPMTGRQRWFLTDLCQKANETLNEALTKAEASNEIERLKAILTRKTTK